jgi:hypothetical protein
MKTIDRSSLTAVATQARDEGLISQGAFDRMTDGTVSSNDLGIAKDAVKLMKQIAGEGYCVDLAVALKEAISKQMGEQGFWKTAGESIPEYATMLGNAPRAIFNAVSSVQLGRVD